MTRDTFYKLREARDGIARYWSGCEVCVVEVRDFWWIVTVSRDSSLVYVCHGDDFERVVVEAIGEGINRESVQCQA